MGAVQALAALGANLEARDQVGSTALHFCAANGQVDTINALREVGADIEAKDDMGRTSLHYSASSGASNPHSLPFHAFPVIPFLVSSPDIHP
jgi:cytohesin